jgi:hypothetical protein
MNGGEASRDRTTLNDADEDQQFILFPNLSIEIRIKIWKCAFVRRHVELDIRTLVQHNMGVEVTDVPPSPYIPVTLAVNQESYGSFLSELGFQIYTRHI